MARPALCTERGTPGTGVSYGAFATHRLSATDELVAVPDGLDLRGAALAEPLAVALHGLTQGGNPGPGSRVYVAGAGPIGALVIAALRARGVEDITVCEPGSLRRDLAVALGASRTVVPDDLEVPPMWEPMRVVDGAVDVAFECSGKGPATEAALAQLDKAGTLVLVGAGIDAPTFVLNRILLNELVVTGAFEYDADGTEAAVELLAAGAIPTAALLEPGSVGLDDLVPTIERLARGEIAGKVLVAPNPGGSHE
jgi:threonine dehydrogenase-like Zn-dependent dehydrogenase